MENILVIVLAVLAIIWVNWYFLIAGRSRIDGPRVAGGVQEVAVRVAGGYDPANIRLRRGVPARLIFDRQEAAGCSEEIVLPAFGIRRFLPPHARTSVEFTPQEPGQYEFTCGMQMLRGRLIVED